jgi:hypothetical protein
MRLLEQRNQELNLQQEQVQELQESSDDDCVTSDKPLSMVLQVLQGRLK